MLTVGALFAGYGGLELALADVAQTRLEWYAENDARPARVMAHHYPGIPNLGDVTAVDWWTVPRVDVITGGTPCQDLSNAGYRLGMRAGTRSGLWAAMRDAIAVIRPALVIWENVRGATSASADCSMEPCQVCLGDGSSASLRALGRVVGDLASIRYDARWVCVPATDAGAPHKRERVFVVAYPSADAYKSGLEGWRPFERADQRPSGEGRVGPGLTLLPTPADNDMGGNKTLEWWDEWTSELADRLGNGNGHGKSLSIEARRLFPTPRASDGKGDSAPHGTGGPDLRTAVQQWGEYGPAIERWADVLGRPAPLPVTDAGNLSPYFVEWLMGLPLGWVTDPAIGLTRRQQLKALGNGVVPQQAAYALRYLADPPASPVAPVKAATPARVVPGQMALWDGVNQ